MIANRHPGLDPGSMNTGGRKARLVAFMGPDFRQDDRGFTLVELLVSLFIFAMLAAAGVSLLTFSVRAQAAAEARLGDLAALRRAGALLASDLAQAAPRVSRDESGASRPAFEGGTGAQAGPALAFVRRGWENVDDSPRPSLQKVEYRLAGDRLERLSWPLVDGARPSTETILLDGVRRIRLRYRTRRGEWRDRWDPSSLVELPRAVELVIDVRGNGVTRQLFLAGPGG
jgi:general secretion pathway protein J